MENTGKVLLKKESRTLVIITCILILIGLIFIYSSSSIFALEKCGSSAYFVKKQAFGVLLGIFALLFMRIIPLAVIKQFTPLFFLTSLALTAFTLKKSIALTIHGSSRWLSLAGFAFQPSELLKMGLILYVAYLLSKKEYSLSSFIFGYLPFLIILGITGGVLLLQPDFGLTVTLFMTVFLLLFIAHFNARHLMLTLLAGLPFKRA